ncbi:MAG TPA: hypothetical protein PLQ84_03940 [Bacteroidales bacterium]|nr:hypothetical protein [Bacteroidales bacterium]
MKRRLRHLLIIFQHLPKDSYLLEKKRSKLSLTASITESEKQLLEVELSTAVSIAEHQSLVFGKKDLKIKIFPIIFHLTSDYPFEGMPEVSFVEDFTRMAKMKITNFHGQEVANVTLATIPGRNRINLYAHFVDGSKEDLEQIMSFVVTVTLESKLSGF